MAKEITYSEKLKDPRWQKKRLRILERDKWVCQICGDPDSTLNVHHKAYTNSEPWDTPDEYLITLCEGCHELETEKMQDALRELNRSFKLKFFSGSIMEIAMAVREMQLNHLPEVVATYLTYLLTSEEEMENLKKRYFKSIVKPKGKSK